MRDIVEWKTPAITLWWLFVYLYACVHTPAVFLLVVLPLILLFSLAVNYIDFKYFAQPKVRHVVGVRTPKDLSRGWSARKMIVESRLYRC